MAKTTNKFSELLEAEWVESLLTAWNGAVILAVGGLLLYLTRFHPAPGVRLAELIFSSFAIALGLVIVGLSVWRGKQASDLPTVPFPCPYCTSNNLFIAPPTDDFECDHCHRTVHFAFGEPVPVRTVICQYCHTEHRVAMTVQRYVCDRCNRLLDVGSDPTKKVSIVGTAAVDSTEALLQNYDVLLVAYDRRTENELALKLVNLMVVNMPEAKRQMVLVSAATPLTVVRNLPHRKAESIRRQLQELGATASLRSNQQAPTAGSGQPRAPHA
ncbi:MAG: hypothetical protein KGJ62_13365 [Armatimonadetes bacterium]|nr:hypothetical protein [Armatimonadota bacterium]MDE2206849.1 hypothetical protein [Armatimonadota bacterium]